MKQDINLFLNAVSAISRTQGYVSRNDAFNSHGTVQPTFELAWHYWRNVDDKTLNNIVIDEDLKATAEALEWVRNLSETECNTPYMKNLYAFCNPTVISYNESGFVASLFKAFQNNKNYKEKNAFQASQHVGELGEDINTRVKVVRISDTKYGKAYKMADAGGNLFVFFSSNLNFATEGEIFKIRGKVKKHDEFKGVRSTVLHFCLKD